MASNLDIYLQRYSDYVIKNPLVASEIEVGLKWISYLAAGRFSHAPVITEFVHTVSNLLTHFNDNLLRKAAEIPVYDNAIVERLQNYLAVIEYSEVFAEFAVNHLVGRQGRWLIIVLLQIIKAVIRLILLVKYKTGIQHSPSVPPLNRKTDIPAICGTDKDKENGGPSKNVEVSFALKRSGRIVRAIDAAPPLVSRSWKLPNSSKSETKLHYRSPSALSDRCLTGEMLHICRPLIHLLSLYGFGEHSWKPWLIAFGIDTTSLHLLHSGHFNRAEKLEISRRALSMIIYLLRSPFYDQYAKIHIINSMKTIADNIPGSGILLRPIMEYIPEWQQSYFYNWAL